MHIRAYTITAALAAILVVGMTLGGCVTQPSDTDGPVQTGVNPDPTKGPGEVVMPAEPDLTTPEAAVKSYLDWVTLAFRMANSELATAAMTPYEHVRVDSYIELNRQDGRAIDQTLEEIELETVSVEETVAVVVARERWTWRYFALDSISWSGEQNGDSYDATYTVLLEPDGAWRVDLVEASLVDPAGGSADE